MHRRSSEVAALRRTYPCAGHSLEHCASSCHETIAFVHTNLDSSDCRLYTTCRVLEGLTADKTQSCATRQQANDGLRYCQKTTYGFSSDYSPDSNNPGLGSWPTCAWLVTSKRLDASLGLRVGVWICRDVFPKGSIL